MNVRATSGVAVLSGKVSVSERGFDRGDATSMPTLGSRDSVEPDGHDTRSTGADVASRRLRISSKCVGHTLRDRIGCLTQVRPARRFAISPLQGLSGRVVIHESTKSILKSKALNDEGPKDTLCLFRPRAAPTLVELALVCPLGCDVVLPLQGRLFLGTVDIWTVYNRQGRSPG